MVFIVELRTSVLTCNYCLNGTIMCPLKSPRNGNPGVKRKNWKLILIAGEMMLQVNVRLVQVVYFTWITIKYFKTFTLLFLRFNGLPRGLVLSLILFPRRRR